MKSTPKIAINSSPYSGLSAAELLAILVQKDAQWAQQLESKEDTISSLDQSLQSKDLTIAAKDSAIQQRDTRILLLEEMLRLKKVQQFAASSEKHVHQIQLFDEAEVDTEIEALLEQLPEETAIAPKVAKKRQRGFSDTLVRERIELTLSDAEKVGASKVFFTKVKEELLFIPAQLKVLEIWQEKAVFEQHGLDVIIAAKRPIHPLGKCIATTALLAYIITSKYADGLPLYRLEQMLKRLGHDVGRTSMAHWVIRLEDVFKPLINLIREVQNGGRYLQADETRIQVLKETGKIAQSDKWMWVIRGGPPGQLSVLFDYDPPVRGAYLCAYYMDLPASSRLTATQAMVRSAVKTTSPVSAAGTTHGASLSKRPRRSRADRNPKRARPPKQAKRMWRWGISANSMPSSERSVIVASTIPTRFGRCGACRY
ncbi:MAG: transposase [Motiliproteus sp.]|jgi:transposase